MDINSLVSKYLQLNGNSKTNIDDIKESLLDIKNSSGFKNDLSIFVSGDEATQESFYDYMSKAAGRDDDNFKEEVSLLFNILDSDQSGNISDDEIDFMKRTQGANKGKVDTFSFWKSLDVDESKVSDIEDDYLEALQNYAGTDSDNSNLSYTDLSNINAETSQSLKNSENNYANTQNYTPVAKSTENTIANSISLDELNGETYSDLVNARNIILNQIDTFRNNGDDDIQQAKQNVADKKAAYDKALEQLNNDEIKNENGQTLNDLKAQKEEKDSQIEKQNSVIDDFKNSISSQRSVIEGLNNSLNSLVEPSEDDYKTTDENGNEIINTDEYNAAKEEYENQKTELEQNISDAQNVLADLEENLAEAETALNTLENEADALNTEIANLTQQIIEQENDNTIANEVQTALEEYNAAQQELKEVEAYIEDNIAQLQQNLAVYDEAIENAKQSEEAKQTEEAEQTEESDDSSTATVQSTSNTDSENLANAGYSSDERIMQDEDGNYFVEAQSWKADSSVNGCLEYIIKNSYDFDALGVSEDDARDKLLDAIVETNNISNPNLIYVGQKIVLPNAAEVLGIKIDTGNIIETQEDDTAIKEDDTATEGNTTATTSDVTYQTTETDENGRTTTLVGNDSNGNVVSETNFIYNSEDGSTINEQTVRYDEENEITSRTDIYNNDDGSQSIYETTYSEGIENSKILTEKDSDGNVTGQYTITYDMNGNEVKTPIGETDPKLEAQQSKQVKTYKNGELVSTATYDENGNKISEESLVKETQSTEENSVSEAQSTDKNSINENQAIEQAQENQDTNIYANSLNEIKSIIDEETQKGNYTNVQNEMDKIKTEILPNMLEDESLSVSDKAELIKSIVDINDNIMTDYLSQYSYPSNSYETINDVFNQCETISDAINLSNAIAYCYPDGSSITGLSSYMYSQNLKTNSEEIVQFATKLADLYNGATQEQINELNNTFDTNSLIQSMLSGDDKSTVIENLVSNLVNNSQVENSNILNSEGQECSSEELAELKKKYTISYEIIDAYDKGNLTQSQALYLFDQIGSDKISSEINNMSHEKNKGKYLNKLLSLYANT